jgi:para-nitrobenzyl esterase
MKGVRSTRDSLLLMTLVLLAGCTSLASPPSIDSLAGTSWQLVKFQGGDDRVLVPDDKSKYTLAFAADGSLNARIDCNRGRGTWKSSPPNQLELSPMALTRAACPPGSLHDRLVSQLPYVRSYIVKNGRLFLSLMADGGIYEFEPSAR